MIGNVIGSTYSKREKESAVLRIGGDSWTIPIHVLETRAIDRIRYVTEAATYEITFEDAATHGFERMLGGERKLIVPVKHWTRRAKA